MPKLRVLGPIAMLVGLFALPSCSVPDTAMPVLIDLEPAIQLSAGLGHTCATLQNGNVGCWGKSDRGELGQAVMSSESSTKNPMALPILEKVDFIAAGTEGSCAVIEGKTVRCWGDGRMGQLGIDLG